MNPFRQMTEAARAIPDVIAARLQDFAVSFHRPVDIGTPSDPEAWCRNCRKPWPCDEFVRLANTTQEHQ